MRSACRVRLPDHRRARAGRVERGPHPERHAAAAGRPAVRASRRSRPTATTPLLVHCAVGARSLRASACLARSATPTSSTCGPRLLDWRAARRRLGGARAAAHPGAAAPLQPPGPDPRDRAGGAAQAARREGAADRRRRPRLAGGALPGGVGDRHHRPGRRRRGRRVATSSARCSTPSDRVGHAQDRERADDPRRAQPRDAGGRAPRAPGRRQRRAADRRLRRDRRRDRQLRHPLPAQRRGGQAAQAGGPRLDLPLGRPGHHLRPVRGAVLPLHVPHPAAGRAGAGLRRGRACWACCRGSPG